MGLAASARPTVAQQITWVYANETSLSAATFLTLASFVEIQPLKQKKGVESSTRRLRITSASATATRAMRQSRGAGAPPVTLTLVVPTRADADAWHAHPPRRARIQLTDAHHSTFDVYAFNYYDTDSEARPLPLRGPVV